MRPTFTSETSDAPRSRLGDSICVCRHGLSLALALNLWVGRACGEPAALESELTASLIAPCRLAGNGGAGPESGSRSFTASFLGRRALGTGGWYLAGGMQAENFLFAGDSAAPRRLQDYAAVIALQFYHDGENVGAFTARPGWYFENHPVARAWDVPVDLISGVPLTRQINGVIGISTARFYHHPLPIFGLLAPLGPHTDLQLVFPEPAIIYAPGAGTSWRLRGELTGTGFLAESRPGRSVVEYASYLVGVEFRRTSHPGRELSVGAGIEAMRNFDFFHEHCRLHGNGAAYLKTSFKFSG